MRRWVWRIMLGRKRLEMWERDRTAMRALARGER